MAEKDKEEKKEPELKIDLASRDFKIPFSETFKGIGSLGEISGALTVGMPAGIFDGYKGILDSQKEIVKSFGIMVEPIARVAGQVGESFSKINSILAPMAGSVLDMGLVANNANKLLLDGVIGKDGFLEIQKFSSIAFDAFKASQDSLLIGIANADNLAGLIKNPSIMSIPMTATGLDALTRAMPIFPTEFQFPTLERIRYEDAFDELEIKKAHKLLDDLLGAIDPKLVEARRGCWETFGRKKSDYVRQASSSMRGLVDTLLRKIAPKDEVVKTDYFRDSPEAKTEKGLPTRKAKIYYAVNYDSKKAERLRNLATGLDEFHQNLSAWDHEPIDNDQFVYGSLITIEGCIIALLSEKRAK